MTATLYTVGYEKRTPDEFVALLRAAAITALIDVRETARSRKPGFSRTALASALEGAGIAYVHASFAGNPKRLRTAGLPHADVLSRYAAYLAEEPALVERFAALVREVDTRASRIAIMCFERDPAECHRTILADAWAAREGGRVVNL